MKNNKKVTVAIIITILIGILTIAGSFALWSVQLGNINVSLNTENIEEYVEYTEGIAVFNDNLQASANYSGGSSTAFTIKTKNNSPYPFYASIKMKVNSISPELNMDTALKWTVRNSTTTITESNFLALESGTTTTLVPNIEATSTLATYNVYLWLDSQQYTEELDGKYVDVELWMEVYQQRYPKALDVYCIKKFNSIGGGMGINELDIICNVLDSEMLIESYQINSSNQYSLTVSDIWSSFNITAPGNLADTITIYTSDGRSIQKEIYAAPEK